MIIHIIHQLKWLRLRLIKKKQKIVYAYLFREDYKKSFIIKKIRYKIEDTVTVKFNKKIFYRGYKQNFSEERFVQRFVIFKSNSVTYQVKDSDNHSISKKY